MFSLPTEKIWLKSYVCEARNLQMKPGHHKALKKEINVCLPPSHVLITEENRGIICIISHKVIELSPEITFG